MFTPTMSFIGWWWLSESADAEYTLRHRIDEMIATVNDRFGNVARASGPEAPQPQP